MWHEAGGGMPAGRVLETVRREIVDSGKDTRYKPGAYIFVLNGLEFLLTRMGEKRHVHGRELSLSLLQFAEKQFGPMARKVLESWGIHKTDDFGYIVYNLIDIGLMSRRDEDSVEDFFEVEDFNQRFRESERIRADRRSVKHARFP